jgi:V-type H+-transporting ATPase subunit a
MSLVQLVIPFDVAHDTVDELGKLGVVQFKDMNPGVTAPQRAFVNDVKRIDEMERKLRFFHTQVHKFSKKYDRPDFTDLLDRDFTPAADASLGMGGMSSIPELENEFEDLERAMVELNQGEDGLRRSIAETFEKRYVLEIVQTFFAESGERAAQAAPLLGGGPSSSSSSLTTIVGSIPRDRVGVFERVLWRVTRGNNFLKYGEIEHPVMDPHKDEYVEKDAFLILSQSANAVDKIRKLSESFGANLYDCPESFDMQRQEIALLRSKENDLQLVLSQNARGCEQLFLRIAQMYDAWRARILKEKAIYHTLNLFRYNLGGKALIAEGWCPTSDLERVSYASQVATKRSGSVLPVVFKPILHSKETPPTYFKTNKFTWAHQHIVDSYGMARYQEINPTVFSIITFPFLFGVMFGDVGHGILMLLFASFLLYKEQEFLKGGLNEMVQTCFDGRYIIVLMAVFAIYNGFLYNEFFSVSMSPGPLHKTSMFVPQNNESLTLMTNTEGFVYMFGVDPMWKGSENELYYFNSLKMKMSVLLGVTQMLLGIAMSGLNAVYRRKWYDLTCEFIPQVLFMLSIFGYLGVLIVSKWFVQSDELDPSLLNTIVDMFLSPLSVNSTNLDNRMYSSQMYVQVGLLLLALVCVPWMLVPKPYLLKRDHERRAAGYTKLPEGGNVHLQDEEADVGVAGEDDEEFEFNEVMIHQVIHTIEYVLGAISNTASYLRLWALSLAHSELSTVFWDMIFVKTLTMQNPIASFIGFGAWAGLSFAVLMVMESLSAFLHALRLHWVEFQNKFYGGDGYKFLPFSYERLLLGQEE